MSARTNVLITGCARGSGRALATAYLLRPSHTVVAAVRDPASVDSQTLTSLPAGKSSSLILVQIDSGSERDAFTAVSTLTAQHDLDHLDIVIANAGIASYFGPASSTPPEQALSHYRINVLVPLLLFQATSSLLLKAAKPKFVTMSSGAGSIAGIDTLKVENTAYVASKAALNFVTKRIHAENETLIAFPINPGWLQTELGNHAATSSGIAQAPVSVEDGVKGILHVVDGATREGTSGRFMSADGKQIPCLMVPSAYHEGRNAAKTPGYDTVPKRLGCRRRHDLDPKPQPRCPGWRGQPVFLRQGMVTPSPARFEDMTEAVGVLDWSEQQIEEKIKNVTGEVIEFAFGPDEHSYLATSYPHRPEYAGKDEIRLVAKQGIRPEVVRQIARLQPRFIMNLAFGPNSKTWFIYYYGTRFTYDAKWQPRKPDVTNPIGAILDLWRQEARDQVSCCSFGEDKDTWFMRSTNRLRKWHPQLGDKNPVKLKDAFNTALRDQYPIGKIGDETVWQTKLRAVTFGHRGAWILYSEDSFKWSDGLPKKLVSALEQGKAEHWKINKAVLNPRNPKEYVLVFDHGPVWCSFYREFNASFNDILNQWSEHMRSCGKYPDHDYTLDYHREDPNDVELGTIAEPAFTTDVSEDVAVKEPLSSSPQLSVQRIKTREREQEARQSKQHRYSDQSLSKPKTTLSLDGRVPLEGDGGPEAGEGDSGFSREHNPVLPQDAGDYNRSWQEIERGYQMRELQVKVRQLELLSQQQQQQLVAQWNQHATLGSHPVYYPHQFNPQAHFQGGVPFGYTTTPSGPLHAVMGPVPQYQQNALGQQQLQEQYQQPPQQPSQSPPQQQPLESFDPNRSRSERAHEVDEQRPLQSRPDD